MWWNIMIEYKQVRFSLHPSDGILMELRDMVYKRSNWATDSEEDMLECLVDMFVDHGNRCCNLGRKLEQ